MENLTFVVQGMNGEFFFSILDQAYDISLMDEPYHSDFLAMMCGL